jgi:hypothetical protein
MGALLSTIECEVQLATSDKDALNHARLFHPKNHPTPAGRMIVGSDAARLQEGLVTSMASGFTLILRPFGVKTCAAAQRSPGRGRADRAPACPRLPAWPYLEE